jgi:uncharacterized membrane-anchored protein YjiN (DUF445 family)
MESVLRVLPFILPPLLGAVIGYITNALAIRMLFRPLEEKRILGIRVPLTPGIIPRQREQLAHSIARMVSEKLLTEDLLLARLHDPEFSASLERTVGSFTSDVLSGQRRTSVDQPDEPAREHLAQLVTQIVSGFFRSATFGRVVHQISESLASGALRTRAGRILPADEQLAAIVERVLDALVDGPASENVEDAVRRWVRAHLEFDTPLRGVLGDAAIERISAMVPAAYDPAVDALLSFLRQDSTREQLSIHGQKLLERILKRLNVFQRLLVSATQYDRNLRETMPAIVDDVIASIASATLNHENRARLINALQKKVREIGDTGVKSLLDRFDLHADDMLSRLFALAVDLLRRDDVRRRIGDGVRRFVDRHREATLGEIVQSLSGSSPEEVTADLVGMADRWIEDEGNRERLAARVVEFISARLSGPERTPLGDLIPLSADQKADMDRFLTERLQALVSRRVPEIITGLDVYTMVVNKINALDVESVEQLLLMVISRHLKWINLFGALLGSLIGGAQVLVSQLL